MRGHIDIRSRATFDDQLDVDVVATCDPTDPETVTVVTGLYSGPDFAFYPDHSQLRTGVSAGE